MFSAIVITHTLNYIAKWNNILNAFSEGMYRYNLFKSITQVNTIS